MLEKKNAGSARIRISFLNAGLHPQRSRIYLECDAQARKDGAAAQLHIRFVHEQRGDTVPSTCVGYTTHLKTCPTLTTRPQYKHITSKKPVFLGVLQYGICTAVCPKSIY